MRVIAGSRRRLLLKTTPGMDVRPTTDRTKETLFNILNPYIPGCRFLDLFSGSGAIGIEALSRGASDAVMVEMNKNSLDCINENLTTTKLKNEARVLAMDVFGALKLLEAEGKVFDIVFMDPPYNNELEKQVLERMANASYIDEDTIIVVEASLETKFDYVEDLGYSLERSKDYKTNKHVFLKRLK